MRFMKILLAGAIALGVAGPSLADEAKTDAGTVTYGRLKHNTGITLQWIGWDDRGVVMFREAGGVSYLSGGQIDPAGGGSLWLDGEVIDAGDDYFTFEGLIRIANSPDTGRICEDTKRWHFAITQDRKYYRLREFEWCDGLTDYIDIYF